MSLSLAQIQQFKIDGYLVLPNALESAELKALNQLTKGHLEQRIPPFELEADVNYPGAPSSINEPGGQTIRRLLHAYQRGGALALIAQKKEITSAIQNILDTKSLFLNPNHHNCIMTKQAQFSSETLWHRDTRYWNFNNKYLINAWFALGDELEKNGAMKILPGSHRWEIDEGALDHAQFLKLDHPFNKDRLDTQRLITLNAGDCVLFSAHCFHAAGKNTTTEAKYSLVFTYHSEKTQGVDGRSTEIKPIQVT